MKGLLPPSAFFRRVMLIVLASAAGTYSASADPIYVQPPTHALGGNASQHDPNNFGSPFPFQYTAFDDFVGTSRRINRKSPMVWKLLSACHDPISEFMIAF